MDYVLLGMIGFLILPNIYSGIFIYRKLIKKHDITKLKLITIIGICLYIPQSLFFVAISHGAGIIILPLTILILWLFSFIGKSKKLFNYLRNCFILNIILIITLIITNICNNSSS